MRWPAAALVVLALAGCGSNGGPGLVQTTATKLGSIQSGDVRLALLATPQGAGGQHVGFEVRGPIQLPKPGQLPVARLKYTQVIGSRRADITLIAKGEQGWLRVGGRTYELEADQVEQLRSVAGALQAAGGLSRLDLRGWIADPKEARCGALAPGEDVDCVKGTLDVSHAAADLLGLARAVGRDVPQLEGAGSGALGRSVYSTAVRMATGHDDHLLRSLRVDVTFKRGVAEPLGDLLGGLAGGTLHFAFDVTHPNGPVDVTAPRDALPYSQLSDRSAGAGTGG